MLPRLALSVRQPWAWAIVYAGKDIENRSWHPSETAWRRRGRVAVHTGHGMTRAEYESGRDAMAALGVTCPPAAELVRGGILGSVDVVDVVRSSASRWFFGPRGFVLRDPRPCVFVPVLGDQFFFEWQGRPPAPAIAPARWMLPASPVTPDLFG